jgi:hypothetical protein
VGADAKRRGQLGRPRPLRPGFLMLPHYSHNLTSRTTSSPQVPRTAHRLPWRVRRRLRPPWLPARCSFRRSSWHIRSSPRKNSIARTTISASFSGRYPRGRTTRLPSRGCARGRSLRPLAGRPAGDSPIESEDGRPYVCTSGFKNPGRLAISVAHASRLKN